MLTHLSMSLPLSLSFFVFCLVTFKDKNKWLSYFISLAALKKYTIRPFFFFWGGGGRGIIYQFFVLNETDRVIVFSF